MEHRSQRRATTARFASGGVGLGYRKTQRSGTGLTQSETYARARHYSTSSARWTTIDPIGAESNPYRYCADNPVVRVDPTGKLEVRLDPRSNLGKLGCGSRPFAGWHFTLDHDVPKGKAGYIVQQVSVSCSVGTCQNGCCPKTGFKTDTFSYFEVWHVSEGQDVEDHEVPTLQHPWP
jgi:RHS repeat-associated protein